MKKTLIFMATILQLLNVSAVTRQIEDLKFGLSKKFRLERRLREKVIATGTCSLPEKSKPTRMKLRFFGRGI